MIINLQRGSNWVGLDKLSGGFVATYRNAFYVGQFSCGMAEIHYKNHRWGYIDTLGNKALPSEYESISRFNHGFSFVKEQGNAYSIIDTSGEVKVRNLAYSTSINYGSCIIASREAPEYSIFNGLSIKKINMMVSRADGDGFLRGFAIVEGKMDGNMALIHVSGEQVPTLSNGRGVTLEISRPVDGRYACVEEINGEKTVFLWRLGKESPEKSFRGYGSVIVYPNGFIALSRNGSWGIYLDSGAEVFPPQIYWMTECEVPGVFPYGDVHAMKGFITIAQGKGSDYKWVIGKPQYTSFEYIGCNIFICHGETADDPIIKEF